jgi:hypothetical protein
MEIRGMGEDRGDTHPVGRLVPHQAFKIIHRPKFRKPYNGTRIKPTGSLSRSVLVGTADRASIVDTSHVGLCALRRIEGCDGSIRVAYKTVDDAGLVLKGARDEEQSAACYK